MAFKVVEEAEIRKLREVYNFSEEEIIFLEYMRRPRGHNRDIDLGFIQDKRGNINREKRYKVLQGMFTKLYRKGVSERK